MILFTADIHIKLGQRGVPQEWAKNRFKMFLDQLEEVSKSVDLHIIGGDTFDRVPSITELSMFLDLVCRSTVRTLIFDGNHEATKKGKTFLTDLKDYVNKLNPLVEVVDDVREFEFGTIVPYCKIKQPDVFEGHNELMPLFTHVRGSIPPHVKPEINLDKLSNFPVVFAGDLHAHSNSQLNIVYPGSPMTTSFHRNNVKTGFLLINGTNWEWKEFNLPQLIRKTVSSPSEMIPTEFDHTIYEIEGNIEELSDVENSELLDRKIVRRSTEASLILNSNMTVTDELSEYLLYILELEEESVANILDTFNDYT